VSIKPKMAHNVARFYPFQKQDAGGFGVYQTHGPGNVARSEPPQGRKDLGLKHDALLRPELR
jgi:hypothetical protein